jgi:hypothetical protein
VSYGDLAGLVTLRPLERPLTERSRRDSPFRASWTNTVELLADELRAHGARHAVLEIAFREQDLRLDGLPRADARSQSPGIVLSFEASRVPGKPQLRYEVTEFTDWQANVRAVALGLQALRAVDRYGVTKRGEQYAGWKQLAAGTGIGDGDPTRGLKLIEAAGGDIKAALHDAHPDHGGEPEDFRDIIAARDRA